MTHAWPSPSCKQPEKVGLCVCVCVCVCVITRWFVFMSNSQFITTTRLISFPQIRTVLRVIGPNFQTKDFSPFTFFTLDPCVCFGLLESKKTCTLKSSLKGKKK
jgi:hypothetical protein